MRCRIGPVLVLGGFVLFPYRLGDNADWMEGAPFLHFCVAPVDPDQIWWIGARVSMVCKRWNSGIMDS